MTERDDMIPSRRIRRAFPSVEDASRGRDLVDWEMVEVLLMEREKEEGRD